ncbi:hypothetical protein LY90DRAFT_669419 [Neocallimastix californiae]|uniref:RNA polymerase II subunit B1 CTD phosphatase RPAP2 homolog n=1 Tax=Neocallimastix californiae TaxID=1754190 RepID=A0A1Y2DAQ9_9FUNG|nr:hypothetical protein LY90DRAFT_669419 [Neocallimastix californiae]|eukprot:ORY56234.1 hypothetical protein LY90DRAFT_669419 [Neocallimastix californiae]
MLYNETNKPNIRKVPKKSSDRLKVPKHSKKTKEQIEKVSILEKAKWEFKIMELQEKMFETPVTIKYLKYIAKYFQPAHYEEVVIERKSQNLCGYPLCNKKTQELKGKYRLSSSKKKIFDITELKSYCGSDCMISSRYYASQLLDEPVYLRNLETIKEVDVIPLGVNIENWILKENEKLNSYTERSLDSYVKSMMKSLPNLENKLIIHEHFGDNNSNNIQPIIEKSSFQYDSIEGYHYKPHTNNKKHINKPSTIILDKGLLNSYSKLDSNDKRSLKKNGSKEKVVSSVVMNREDANKFNELYEQYAREQHKKEEEKLKKEKSLNNSEKKETSNNTNNDNTKEEITSELSKLKLLNEITENNNLNLTENKSEVIIEEFNKLNIKDTPISKEENMNNEKKTISSKKSIGILKKSNSVSKENLKVRFNDDTSVKFIENKEEMNKAYQENSNKPINKKKKNNRKEGKNSRDVFYSYDVIEKSGVQKDILKSNAENVDNKEGNEEKNKEINEENIDENENDSEKKVKSLFEMNKDLEKILKITEMTKEEARKKQKKKLIPTLSLFGKTWTTISRMITNETRLFLNSKISEDELNEMLLVDDDIMNTRKDILITNIMKSFSSIKLEHGIITSIENELILLIKSFVVNESMVVLSSVEYWTLTVVFLKALTKRNKLLEEEISEEKWKKMIETVEVPYYQLVEFVNLFN